MFDGTYEGRTVLITGHTGFKGSWMTLWLQRLGAEVVGLSDTVPGPRSHFRDAGLETSMQHYWADVRDLDSVSKAVQEVEPEFLFHLAAQPLVTESYDTPIRTIETNVMGTANVMEALRSTGSDCTAIMVTSDKCYENTNTYYGYRETEPMGGADPYSASKGAAEIVISGYLRSFFADASSARVGIVRSGNVIGGGDWSADRLVPDIVRAWESDDVVSIRRPGATRPWQHVLEPLAGYLHLAARLRYDDSLHQEAFNFGPRSTSVQPVSALVEAFGNHLPGLASAIQKEGWNHEAAQLGLNCDKATALLDWSPAFDFDETIEATAAWYAEYRDKGAAAAVKFSDQQISDYTAVAKERGLVWASEQRPAA